MPAWKNVSPMSSVTSTDGPAFRPWHFFVVLTLVAATVAVLTSRTVTPEHLIMLSVTIFAAGGTALAMYRTLLPLVGRERRLSRESLGHRARAALDREKSLVLRSIKELEFDRAMGKVADEDFDEMSRRLRARALGLMQQLDADIVAPRERLERELAARLRDDRVSRPAVASSARHARQATPVAESEAMCPSCGAVNDDDARFCKACGTRLTAHANPSSGGTREAR